MSKELEISERFDIDDIRKIRSYNAERYAGMTPAEIVEITRVGAEKENLLKLSVSIGGSLLCRQVGPHGAQGILFEARDLGLRDADGFCNLHLCLSLKEAQGDDFVFSGI